jgi:uncharacterized protein (DUF2141 family)
MFLKLDKNILLTGLILLLPIIGWAQAPTFTSFGSSSTSINSSLVINGTNLTGTTSLMFGETPARFSVNSNTQITATVPRVANSGSLRITKATGSTLSSAISVTRQSSSNIFSSVSTAFDGINIGHLSAPTFTDLDGDGLLDMLIGEFNGNLNHYEQNAANSTSFTLVDQNFNSIDVGDGSKPTFSDLDGDGLLDMLIGEIDGNLNHYEQNAFNSTSFSLISDNFNTIDVGNQSVPAFTDLDGDGLLDMLVGEFNGNLNHYEQNAANSTSFTLITENFNGLDVGQASAPNFTDLDGDGLLDMLIGEYSGNMNHYEQNAANSTSFGFITANFNSINIGTYSVPVLTDLDGDGVLDMLTGKADGNLNYNVQNQPLVLSTLSTTTACQGATVSITGTGFTGATSVTINGTSVGTLTGVTATNITFTVPANATSGNVVVTTPSGNSNAVAITIINAFPTTPSISGATVICAGSSTLLSNSYSLGANEAYLWSDNSTSSTLSVSAAGTYSLRIRNTVTGCTSAHSNTITVTVNTLPNTPGVWGGNMICVGTPLTSSTTLGINEQFVWSDNSSASTRTFTVAGTYTIRIRNTVSGCTSGATTVYVNPLPTTPTIAGETLICPGGSTILTTTRTLLTNESYLWSNGITTASNSVSAAGTYTLRIRNSFGNCTSEASTAIIVSVNTAPTTPSIQGATSICPGGNTTLTTTVILGSNEAYLWSDNSSASTLSVSSAGTYSLRIRNTETGCTSASSTAITVSVNALPTTPTIAGATEICAGSNTTLSTSYSLGANEAYLWTDNFSASTFSVTTAGTYSLRIRNTVTGCTSAASNGITVSVNALPTTPTITGATANCAGTSTLLSTSYSLGANEAYLWGDNSTASTLSVSSAGTYSLRIRNTVTGCTSAFSIPAAVSTIICNQIFTGEGLFTNSDRWSGGSPPVTGTDISVRGRMSLTSSVSLRNIIIENGGTISIPSGVVLTVTGNLSNQGIISGDGTVKLSGSNNQTFGGGTISNLLVENGTTVIQNTAIQISSSLSLGNNQVLNLNGNALTLLSTATQTARLAVVPANSSIINASNFTVQRWLNPNNIRRASNSTGNYYYTGPVVQNQTVGLWNGVSPYGSETFNQATQSGSRFYFFNSATNSWRKPTSLSQALPAGTGVQVWFGTQAFFLGGRTTWSASGTPVVGNFNMPLTSGFTGFNLVSNPYPSTIDWDSPNWTKTGVANAIYIYDWVNQRYRTYVNGIQTNGASRYLPTAQGFFVNATTTSPVLTAREDIKVSNQVAMQRAESNVSGLIRLSIINNGIEDEMVISNRPEATIAFEKMYDAQKMMNPTTNIFVSGAVNQSIASLNMNSVSAIPFVLQTNATGSVTLHTTEISGMEGYTFNLFNEQTGELLPFTGSESYSFNVAANQPYRLQLRVGSLTGINHFKDKIFEVFPNPATDKITTHTNGTGTLEIVNVVGQVVMTQTATETNEINVSKLAKGIYTVKFNGASQKLVVK